MSSMRLVAGLAVVAALAGAAALAAAPAGGEAMVSVCFELNDAQVKGRRLPGVQVRVLAPTDGAEVAACSTGGDGRCAVRVAPGTYRVSFRLEGFVPHTSGGTEVRDDGQVVTVSLTRPLEATETAGRQVRIILKWGSRSDQVKDADSHLACACGNGHV
ncbi:MAG TPA: carboxypeptidase-like regulatory domain-containing protein [Thermoanaerobaculaceae bacterium]|nr:carboxypeptidase-like regulatory domain-containing protein [Thermoanaerobaculaceae bacterium]HRS17010.1 carboxypeptidase-like regulatory domain-containing protein [Thermoanaerobaculaceae bacterium]